MDHRRRTTLLAAAALLAGCAHAGSAAPPPSAAAAPPGPAGPAAAVVTGSRLPQRVDLSTGLPRTTSAVTVWTRGDLDRTGAPGTGDAVRKLTP